MATVSETKQVHLLTKVGVQGVASVRSVFLPMLEMQIPMGLGALVCLLLVRMVSASSSFAAVYRPGTYLFAAGDVFFLTAPVVVWMMLRGHGWRHSLEMGVAMIMPVAAIALVGELVGYDYLPGLIVAGYPAMSFGLLVYMLYRRDHFAGGTGAGRFRTSVRRFNKATFNRLTLTFAGQRIYGVVKHVGRWSGRTYATPVLALPTPDGFIMALPFGADTDWCRNVLAARKASLQWRGQTHQVTKPEVVGTAGALPLLPSWMHPLLRALRVRQFLRVFQLNPIQNKS